MSMEQYIIMSKQLTHHMMIGLGARKMEGMDYYSFAGAGENCLILDTADLTIIYDIDLCELTIIDLESGEEAKLVPQM